MTIKIIPDGPTIELTESEYARLMQEYGKAFSMFYGTRPTFEEWVRSKKRVQTLENLTTKNLLQE